MKVVIFDDDKEAVKDLTCFILLEVHEVTVTMKCTIISIIIRKAWFSFVKEQE